MSKTKLDFLIHRRNHVNLSSVPLFLESDVCEAMQEWHDYKLELFKEKLKKEIETELFSAAVYVDGADVEYRFRKRTIPVLEYNETMEKINDLINTIKP